MQEELINRLIGNTIKNERIKLKLTQDELGAKIGLEQSNLSNIENGKNSPSFITLCALIEVLNIEPNRILGFLKFNTNKKSILDIELEETFSSLSDNAKKHILALIKMIK